MTRITNGWPRGAFPDTERDPHWTPVLSAYARRVVQAAAEAIFDDGDGVAPEQMAWFLDDVDEHISALSGLAQLGARVAPGVLDLAPILMGFAVKRLTELDLPARRECLRRLSESKAMPYIILFEAFKIIYGMVFFEHPTALARTGYDGRGRFEEEDA